MQTPTPRGERREFLRTGAAVAFGGMAGVTGLSAAAGVDQPRRRPNGNGNGRNGGNGGRLRHSVCRWAFNRLTLEELCAACVELGIESIELLDPDEWPIVAAHGLTCAVANGPTQIGRGLNRVEDHDRFVRASDDLIPRVAAANIPMMIVFSGNRGEMNDVDGLKNCADALKRMVPAAEAAGVTIVMELLNSRIDHRDYQCDRTAWGVELVNEVASPRFRLLYDIYHMQIMEGDVTRTLIDNLEAIAHLHTGGVPGRREIDHTQELNYRFICESIADAGYRGFVGQEFIPGRNPIASLREAIEICTV